MWTGWFYKFCKWSLTFLQEDSGKGSIKRVLAVLIVGVVCYIYIHCIRNGINIEPYLYPIQIALGFAAALLALTYIPTRKQDV